MDIMPAWLGGFLMGSGISLALIFTFDGKMSMAVFFFMIFLAGVAATYWADSEEWSKATSIDQPQKTKTA